MNIPNKTPVHRYTVDFPSKNIIKLKEQLQKQNDLGFKIIYPEQGKKFEL